MDNSSAGRNSLPSFDQPSQSDGAASSYTYNASVQQDQSHSSETLQRSATQNVQLNQIPDHQPDANSLSEAANVPSLSQVNTGMGSVVNTEQDHDVFARSGGSNVFISPVLARAVQREQQHAQQPRISSSPEMPPSQHAGDKSHLCTIPGCEKAFSTSWNLRIHIRKHNEEYPYHCDICKFRFPCPPSLTVHKRTHISSSPEMPQYQHAGEKPLTCKGTIPGCEQAFLTSSYLKIRTHTGEYPYHCDICKKPFLTLSALTAHKRTHTGEKPYKCKIAGCEQAFSTSWNLKNHIRRHTGEYPYHCDICKFRFPCPPSLTVHKRTHISSSPEMPQYQHAGEKPLTCKGTIPGCEQAFLTSSYLKIRTHTGEYPYHCDICKKPFLTLSALTAHKRTHTGEKPYKCKIAGCEQAFSTSWNLKNHIRRHTGEYPYHCDICKFRFPCPPSLTVHKRTHISSSPEMPQYQHAGEKPLTCKGTIPGCEQAFLTSSDLKIRTHTGEYPYHCDICKKPFLTLSALTAHKRTHTGEKPYKCKIAGCEQAFSTSWNLKNHIRRHTGEYLYHCDICKKRFFTSSELTVHKRRTHTGEKPYQCTIRGCEQAFPTSWNLKIHIRKHTGEYPYHCDICKKRFLTSSVLAAHKRTHAVEKPYKCTIPGCEQAFSQSSTRDSHIATHTGEKPYRCDKCSSRFSRLWTLTVHKRTHTGEKPYQCTIPGCEQVFSHSSARDRHIAAHTGEKPYRCDKCSSRFSQLSTLTRHKRTHTGEKPYQCTIPGCEQAFSHSSARDSHIATHTGEKPYRCDKCSSRFSQLWTLTRHKRTHTGEKPYQCTIPGCEKAFSHSSARNRHVRTHKSNMEKQAKPASGCK